jgi:hypothetical protein
MISFGAAHLYGDATKKYKLRVGVFNVNMTYFHVDALKIIDTDNDGVIFDDEAIFNVFQDADGIWRVRILVDPVSPDFVLNTTMVFKNDGDLPWTVTWRWDGVTGAKWGNGTADPCWEGRPTKTLNPADPMWPSGLWSWEVTYWKDNRTRGGGVYPASPTEHAYKPGDLFIVKQHLNLIQPSTPAEVEAYNMIMGKWFWIWEQFLFESEDPVTVSSWTYPVGAQGPGPIPPD